MFGDAAQTPDRFAAAREVARPRLRKPVQTEPDEPPPQVAPRLDPRHDLLAQVTALAVGDGVLETRLLRQDALAALELGPGDPGLDAEGF